MIRNHSYKKIHIPASERREILQQRNSNTAIEPQPEEPEAPAMNMQIVTMKGYLEVGVPKELQKTTKNKKTIPHTMAVKFLEKISDIEGMRVYMVTEDEQVKGIPVMKINNFGQKDINDGTPLSKEYDVFQCPQVTIVGGKSAKVRPNELKKLVGKVLYYTMVMKGHIVNLTFNIESVVSHTPRKAFKSIKNVQGVVLKK